MLAPGLEVGLLPTTALVEEAMQLLRNRSSRRHARRRRRLHLRLRPPRALREPVRESALRPRRPRRPHHFAGLLDRNRPRSVEARALRETASSGPGSPDTAFPGPDGARCSARCGVRPSPVRESVGTSPTWRGPASCRLLRP